MKICSLDFIFKFRLLQTTLYLASAFIFAVLFSENEVTPRTGASPEMLS